MTTVGLSLSTFATVLWHSQWILGQTKRWSKVFWAQAISVCKKSKQKGGIWSMHNFTSMSIKPVMHVTRFSMCIHITACTCGCAPRLGWQCGQNGIDPPGLVLAYLASCPLVEQRACQFRNNHCLPVESPSRNGKSEKGRRKGTGKKPQINLP